MYKLISTYSIITMFLLFGCTSSSTHITSSWKDPNVGNLGDQKVLVLGITNNMSKLDRSVKLNMEQEIANHMKSKGIKAVPASDAFSPKAFNEMNEQQVLDTMKKDGFDAVMTIVLLDKSKEEYYQPGSVRYRPYGVYYDRFWGYYRNAYSRIYDPSYYTTSTNYFWESNLYNLKNDRLLYSVQSKSFDPDTYHSLSMEYARQVVNDMSDQGLVAKN